MAKSYTSGMDFSSILAVDYFVLPAISAILLLHYHVDSQASRLHDMPFDFVRLICEVLLFAVRPGCTGCTGNYVGLSLRQQVMTLYISFSSTLSIRPSSEAVCFAALRLATMVHWY